LPCRRHSRRDQARWGGTFPAIAGQGMLRPGVRWAAPWATLGGGEGASAEDDTHIVDRPGGAEESLVVHALGAQGVRPCRRGRP
jgi:hypothetical protein